MLHLTAYMQSLGGAEALVRVDRQDRWKTPALRASKGTPAENIAWLHDQVPPVWRPMPVRVSPSSR